jgi:hypothetical protein
MTNETFTVTIRPRWPLKKDCAYEVFIGDSQGHVASKQTRKLVIQISHPEGGGKAPATEWAAGQASLFVDEVPTTARLDCREEVGGFAFRFLPKP